MPETPVKRAKKRQPAAEPPQDEVSVEPAPSQPVGRPTDYSYEVAVLICTLIAEGNSLASITKMDGMPSKTSVYDWLLRHKEFAELYTRAREDQADTLADQILEIADEQPEIIAVVDKKTGALIEHKLDGAFLQWQKNRIDARKWTAMKLKPKKYGERVGVHGVDGQPPIKTEETSSSMLFDLIRNMEMTKRAG